MTTSAEHNFSWAFLFIRTFSYTPTTGVNEIRAFRGFDTLQMLSAELALRIFTSLLLTWSPLDKS